MAVRSGTPQRAFPTAMQRLGKRGSANVVQADNRRNVSHARGSPPGGVCAGQEGIRCYYEAETTVGNLWYLGNAIGYVKLQVDEHDVPRTRGILEETIHPTTASSTSIGRFAACRARLEPGFEVCWSCGATLEPEIPPPVEPLSSPRQPSRQDTVVADRGADEDDEQSRTESVERQLDRVGEDLASRAWKERTCSVSSIWTWAFWPWILHGYSFWLVLRLAFRGGSLSPAGNRKVWASVSSI